ncbi:MAG: hemerythrin domain-containing protein [Burkholderiales bacterium]|nr:hemerythrin domain-containing protein [Burkholderiales bacterium]
MKYTLDTIQSEHRSLEAILYSLRNLVEHIRGGGFPDFAGLRAMLYYLDAFSARLHHPKEDEYLFQPLRAHTGEAAAIIDDLELDHLRVAAAMRSLEQTLVRYEAGGEREFADFATAAEGFCDFYARHMRKEERLAMPMAEELFSEEEWARLDAGCAASGEPQGALDECEQFRRLYRRIVGAGSMPPGGDRPALRP